MVHRFAILAAVVACIAGCNREKCGNGADDDGDGFADCADQDCFAECNQRPKAGPGCADGDCVEDCADGEDNDGDYLVDCGDPDDCRSVCDADNDGFNSVAMGGDDCDDNNPDVNPSVGEVPWDGADNDCDPATPDDDIDGDGFLYANDCDDEAAATFPGAPETCGDGVVNDCDSAEIPSRDDCYGSRSLATADHKLIGTNTDDRAGFAVAGAGDVDGDGFADLVVGAWGEGSNATGAAYIIRGPLSGNIELSDADAKLIGESEDDWAAYAVAGGIDPVGNGVPHVLIGAQYDDRTGPNAGAVYVVPGTAEGDLLLANAVAKIVGRTDNDRAGYAVAGMPDLDNDGIDEIVVGAIQADATGLSAGAAYVMYGPVSGFEELGFADIRYDGKTDENNAGCSVANSGNVDGTGEPSLLVGGCTDDGSFVDAGAAYLFTGLVPTTGTMADSDAAIPGFAPDDAMGTVVAGASDISGDGDDDIAITSPFADDNGIDSGIAHLVYSGGLVGPMTPDVAFYGAAAGDLLGISLTLPGDLDGDGNPDVVIGASGNDESAEDAGMVYAFFGPLSGNIAAADADVFLSGEGAFDFAGQAVASAGDVDGDGFGDLLIGAPFNNELALSSGAAYLVTFGY